MFDVDLAGGESYRESTTFRPGAEAVVAALPEGGRLGMSVCYDLRFPQLYRALAKEGAEILSVQEYKHVLRWADAILARPAVQRGHKVNRTWGDLDLQLHERHDASDFDTKTQDKLVQNKAA